MVNLPIAILILYISATFPRLLLDSSDRSILVFLVVARNLSRTGSIRVFQKLLLSPKSRLNVQFTVKLPNMTDWHLLPGLKIDVLIACRRLSLSPQNVECVIYKVQKIFPVLRKTNGSFFKSFYLISNKKSSEQNYVRRMNHEVIFEVFLKKNLHRTLIFLCYVLPFFDYK